MPLDPAPPDPAPLAPTPVPQPDAAALDRVRGVLPVVRGLLGKVRVVGAVSAVSAVVLWAILFGEAAWPLSALTAASLLALGVLLLPAAGTFLAALTLDEVLDLPNRLRALPGAVRETALDVKEQAGPAAVAGGRSRRLWGVFGVLWRLRGIVGDTQSSWLRALALARFARLASLPFALALVGAFALNFAVITAAVVAVVGVVLF